MNELEKKFSLEENSIPETTANAEVVTENVTAEFDNQSETDEEVAQGTRRYFEMEKADLLALLQEIVDSEGVNQHKEVNAIKQAYFAKRKAEIEEEYNNIATAYNMPIDDVKSNIDSEMIAADMQVKKAMDLVKEKAIPVAKAADAE